MKKRRALSWVGALLTPAIGIFLLFMIGEMREMSALRFEAGEQVGAESSEIPGTGIGLAVTNQLIEGMAGKVGFESTMGQGTTF